MYDVEKSGKNYGAGVLLFVVIVIIVILVIFGFYLFNPDGVWEILESIYYTSNIFTPV